MKDEQLKILKTLSEATSRMDLNKFAETIDLSPTQVVEQIQNLTSKGYLRKVGTSIGLTEKGKNVLKTSITLPDEAAFRFYVDVEKPLGFCARSLEEFYCLVRQVCSDSLGFHLYRGDFERWISEVVKDEALAVEIGRLKEDNLEGEAIRKEVLKAIDTHFGLKDLL